MYTDSDLIIAIGNDDLIKVIEIVENALPPKGTLDLNKTNFFTMTPLKSAFSRKNLDIAKYLIEKGAKFISENNELFFDALQWGDEELIESMIQKGIDVNKSYDGKFALIESRDRSINIIKCIANHCNETSIKKLSTNGLSILDLVIGKYSNIETAKFLLDKKVPITSKTKEGFSTMYAAAYNGSLDLIKLLFEYDNKTLKYDPTSRSPIYIALQNKYFDVAEYLIDIRYGFNQSEEYKGMNQNLVTLCIQKNRLDLVDKLLLKNIDVKSQNKYSPLFEAIKLNNHTDRKSVIRKLVAKGYSPRDTIIPNVKYVFEYVNLECSNEIKDLFEELLPPKYKEFKDVTCFDEIEHSDVDIFEFMKNDGNIIVKNNDNFKGYIRKDILDYIQKKGTFYSQEKISNNDIKHLRNEDVRFYDLINTGGKDCILVPYSDAIFIEKYAPKV
jgi:ankyrin repeat protein